MDIYLTEILETLVESSMEQRFGGKESLANLDESITRKNAMRAYRDMFRETNLGLAKVLADRQRASLAVAWEQGRSSGLSWAEAYKNPYMKA